MSVELVGERSVEEEAEWEAEEGRRPKSEPVLRIGL